MKMPQRGQFVYVEGYGGAVFAGGLDLQSEDAAVMLKFEGPNLDKGYGRGIITVPFDEFKENRVYPEQVPSGEPLVESTTKRDNALAERLE